MLMLNYFYVYCLSKFHIWFLLLVCVSVRWPARWNIVLVANLFKQQKMCVRAKGAKDKTKHVMFIQTAAQHPKYCLFQLELERFSAVWSTEPSC